MRFYAHCLAAAAAAAYFTTTCPLGWFHWSISDWHQAFSHHSHACVRLLSMLISISSFWAMYPTGSDGKLKRSTCKCLNGMKQWFMQESLLQWIEWLMNCSLFSRSFWLLLCWFMPTVHEHCPVWLFVTSSIYEYQLVVNWLCAVL